MSFDIKITHAVETEMLNNGINQSSRSVHAQFYRDKLNKDAFLAVVTVNSLHLNYFESATACTNIIPLTTVSRPCGSFENNCNSFVRNKQKFRLPIRSNVVPSRYIEGR